MRNKNMRIMISKALKDAENGSGIITMRFKVGATADLKYFFKLRDDGKYEILSPDENNLHYAYDRGRETDNDREKNDKDRKKNPTISDEDKWKDDNDRTVEIKPTSAFNESCFHGRMENALEYIQAKAIAGS